MSDWSFYEGQPIGSALHEKYYVEGLSPLGDGPWGVKKGRSSPFLCEIDCLNALHSTRDAGVSSMIKKHRMYFKCSVPQDYRGWFEKIRITPIVQMNVLSPFTKRIVLFFEDWHETPDSIRDARFCEMLISALSPSLISNACLGVPVNGSFSYGSLEKATRTESEAKTFLSSIFSTMVKLSTGWVTKMSYQQKYELTVGGKTSVNLSPSSSSAVPTSLRSSKHDEQETVPESPPYKLLEPVPLAILQAYVEDPVAWDHLYGDKPKSGISFPTIFS